MSIYTDIITAEADAYAREDKIYDAQAGVADAIVEAARSMNMTIVDYMTHANLI